MENGSLPELPLGFGKALAQTPQAMQNFSALSGEAQKAFLARAHGVSSKAEMQSLVNTLLQ